MSRKTVIDALNCVLKLQRFSLANYLSEATTWTHPSNELLLEEIRGQLHDHERQITRLAAAIDERDGCGESGSFPLAYMSLNDLSLDYLLPSLLKYQQRDIQSLKRHVAALVEDPAAQSLASEVLGSEQAHYDNLAEHWKGTR